MTQFGGRRRKKSFAGFLKRPDTRSNGMFAAFPPDSVDWNVIVGYASMTTLPTLCNLDSLCYPWVVDFLDSAIEQGQPGAGVESTNLLQGRRGDFVGPAGYDITPAVAKRGRWICGMVEVCPADKVGFNVWNCVCHRCCGSLQCSSLTGLSGW